MVWNLISFNDIRWNLIPVGSTAAEEPRFSSVRRPQRRSGSDPWTPSLRSRTRRCSPEGPAAGGNWFDWCCCCCCCCWWWFVVFCLLLFQQPVLLQLGWSWLVTQRLVEMIKKNQRLMVNGLNIFNKNAKMWNGGRPTTSVFEPLFPTKQCQRQWRFASFASGELGLSLTTMSNSLAWSSSRIPSKANATSASPAEAWAQTKACNTEVGKSSALPSRFSKASPGYIWLFQQKSWFQNFWTTWTCWNSKADTLHQKTPTQNKTPSAHLRKAPFLLKPPVGGTVAVPLA